MAVASIPVDWSLAQQPQSLDFIPSAVEGTQAGQQMSAASALRGINMNDPASVNQGMASLVRAGATDQASALANLGFLRFQQQAAIQGYQQAGDLFSGGGGQAPPAGSAAPSGPTPDEQQAMSAQQMAHAQQVAQFGKTSADQLLSIQDPVLRRAQADAISAKAQQMGVPDSFVQSALGDLSDEHLSGLSANYGAWLQHPTLGGTGTGPMPDLHPTTQAFTQAPNPFSNPNVLKFLMQQGVLRNPQLPAMVQGLTPAQGYTGALAPGSQAVFGGQPTAQAPYAPEKLAPGEAMVSPNTGQQIGATQPFKQESVTVAPGANVFGFNPATGGFTDPNNPSGAPQATGAAGAPQGAVVNNNPAGVKTPPTGKWPGQTGTTPGGLAIFDNPSDGYAAADKNLLSIAETHGINTVAGIVNRWTPPGVDGNPDQGPRIAAISKALGVSPTAPLDLEGNPVLRHALLSQIIQGETGGQQVASAAQPGQAPQPEFGGKQMAPPVPGPHGGLFQTDFTGQVRGTGQALEPAQIAGVRNQTMGNDQVKQAQGVIASWNGLRGNIEEMTGPSAFAMLDNAVRIFNPGGIARQQSLRALASTFGVSEQVAGDLQRIFTTKGPLTPQMRQEVADAAYSFVQSHYAMGAQIVQGQRNFITQQGGDPKALDGILPSMPPHYYTVPPPPSVRVNGAVIDSPKGLLQWNGRAWVRASA